MEHWATKKSSRMKKQGLERMRSTTLIFISTLIVTVRGFAPSTSPPISLLSSTRHHRYWRNNILRVSSETSSSSSSTSEEEEDPLGLTSELRLITDAFASIPDEKTRHKQLLYMASKLPDVEEAVYIPENKVPGCLSTVHVTCDLTDTDKILYRGDSDGLLTKGLLALLVRGLSGSTAEEIQKVNPEFIKEAKISQTLTPGRNNGFLNMLAVMKKKAMEATHADVEATSSSVDTDNMDAADEQKQPDGDETEETNIVTSFDPIDGKPMYNAILSKLIPILKPTYINLVDNSHQHAGHAGSKGWEESGESHFELQITSSAFEELSLVKRHQLIYMLLGDVMEKIHALSIVARTPDQD